MPLLLVCKDDVIDPVEAGVVRRDYSFARLAAAQNFDLFDWCDGRPGFAAFGRRPSERDDEHPIATGALEKGSRREHDAG